MVVKRQSWERRWGLPVEFPHTDSRGFSVAYDRRKGSDRRKAKASLDEIQILFSELPSLDPERKQ